MNVDGALVIMRMRMSEWLTENNKKKRKRIKRKKERKGWIVCVCLYGRTQEKSWHKVFEFHPRPYTVPPLERYVELKVSSCLLGFTVCCLLRFDSMLG